MAKSTTPRWLLWAFEAVSYSVDLLEAICNWQRSSRGISSSRITHNRLPVLKINADHSNYRSPHRVPGHRPPSSYRDKPHSHALPHAHLRSKHRCRQVPLLVFSHEATKSEEVEWRDRQPQRHP